MFDTSDHLPNFTMTKKKIKLNKDDNHRMIRDLSNTNINNFNTYFAKQLTSMSIIIESIIAASCKIKVV